jgi:hypothetical protein
MKYSNDLAYLDHLATPLVFDFVITAFFNLFTLLRQNTWILQIKLVFKNCFDHISNTPLFLIKYTSPLEENIFVIRGLLLAIKRVIRLLP